MKKYYQTDELQKMIDWDNIMKMNRYAGGHDDQMIGLFKDSTLIAHWNENDYQGMVATCVMLSNGKFSNGAYVFENINDVILFLNVEDKDNYSWNGNASSNLLSEILKNVQILRNLKIEKIIS